MEQIKREAAFHTYSVGQIGVTVLSDGYVTVPLAQEFVQNASFDAVRQALDDAGLPTETLTTTFAPVLIQSAGKRYLIDTGLGPDAAAEPGATRGMLLASLNAAGLGADDIDTVIITHFHSDHVNGLLRGNQPVFPKAAIRVPEVEWTFWMDDAERGRASPGRMQTLFANNRRIFDIVGERVTTYGWGEEPAPGLKAVGTPGHSIGHTAFELSSEGKRVFLQSDLTNHAALFLPNPTWYASFDQDPAMSVAVRIETYERLVKDRIPVQAYHHPFPGLAYLEHDGDGYRRVPIESLA